MSLIVLIRAAFLALALLATGSASAGSLRSVGPVPGRAISPFPLAGMSGVVADLLALDFQADTGQAGGSALPSSTSLLTVTQPNSAYDLAASKLFAPNTARRTAAGLLIEAASANVVQYSQDFTSAIYSQDGLAISSTTWSAPDGTQTGNRATLAAGDQYDARFRLGANSFGTSGTQTWSMFYRPGGAARYIHFRVQMANGGNFIGLFDTQTNTYLGAGYYGSTNQGTAPVSASVVPAANGAYRLVFTVVNAGTGQYGGIPLVDFSKFANTSETVWAGGEYADIWGMQAEDGVTTVSSYIPTTSAAVARSADAASITLPSGTGHVDLTYDNNAVVTLAAAPGAFSLPVNPAGTNLAKLRAYP